MHMQTVKILRGPIGNIVLGTVRKSAELSKELGSNMFFISGLLNWNCINVVMETVERCPGLVLFKGQISPHINPESTEVIGYYSTETFTGEMYIDLP